MKKILSLVVALAMLLSMVPSVFAVEDQLPPDVEIQGTADNPIWLNAGENDLTIPAGATVYYVGRFIGMVMDAVGAGLTLEHNGTIYPLGEESTEFACVQPSMWEPCTFVVSNSGDAAVACTLTVSYPLGSMDNPAALEIGYNCATVSAGSQGYYYTWTAEEDGTLAIEMWGESGWFYVVNNMTAYKYGDQYCANDKDEHIPYSEYEVSAGDQIEILINTYDKENPYAAPAGDVEFGAYFTATPGTENNPIWLEETVTTVTVPAGATVYCTGRVNGLNISAVGEGLVLEHNNATYTLGEGATEFAFVAPSMWEPGMILITNSGDADAECTLTVLYPLGSEQNPAPLKMGENSATVTEGSQGCYYTWIAEEDGTLTIEMSSQSWFYTVDNMTSFQYGDWNYSSDPAPVPVTAIEVSAGDLIRVQVNTHDPEAPWAAPAGTVTFQASFEAAGTEEGTAGDANGDTFVDQSDVAMLFAYVMGENVELGAGADVNGDGAIDQSDVAKLFAYVMGQIDSL